LRAYAVREMFPPGSIRQARATGRPDAATGQPGRRHDRVEGRTLRATQDRPRRRGRTGRKPRQQGLQAQRRARTRHKPQSPVAGTTVGKIADALHGGPAEIAKHATILDWPKDGKGPYPVLRKGANGWSCFPDRPGRPRRSPQLRGRQRVGLAGRVLRRYPRPTCAASGSGTGRSGARMRATPDPLATKPAPGQNWVIDGPHLAILPADPRNGGCLHRVRHPPSRRGTGADVPGHAVRARARPAALIRRSVRPCSTGRPGPVMLSRCCLSRRPSPSAAPPSTGEAPNCCASARIWQLTDV